MSAENGKLYAASALKASNLGDLTLTKLPSLTPKRDLTLGGRGNSNAKKVFTPNLNVVRNKNANVKTSKDTTRGGRGRGKTERGRGRGSGNANSALIQTTGVFSEGAGAVNIRKATSGSSSYSRSADDAPSALRKPTLLKTDQRKIDVRADAANIRELLGDSDEDDFVDEKTDLDQIPIKLSDDKWLQIKTESKTNKALNGIINGDGATTTDESTLAIEEKMQKIHMEQQKRAEASVPRYPQSLDEMLKAQQQQIFLMQLPDTLPCEDDDSDLPEKSTSTTAKDANATTSSRKPVLKQIEEGQVGKLLRYKSGKIKLVLGDTHFDLSMGMETGFLQELMAIYTDREERSGTMINLGAIQAKLTATPDWEHLLSHQMSQDPA